MTIMATLLGVYTAVVGFLLFIFLLTTLMNLFLFPKLRVPSPVPQLEGKLSILIPARNEAVVIYETVRRLLNQTLGDFELIILDDQSEDDTAVLIRKAAQDDPRLRLISGQPLPEGWLGKNWACHQLAQSASGDWLLFADADVQWKPQALAALIANQQNNQADLLTVWPTQLTNSWAEKLVIPLMKFSIISYLPHLAVNHFPWPIFAAANGQCLLF
ncbi:MAG: glycosyltransferase, partial [Anaerolineales bacterium]|nr:glycosyltransferase [Anaerolineales bacterium]